MTAPTLSLVVPMYNEEDRLAEFGPRLVRFASEQAPHVEIVFVDDGSSDRTVEVAAEILGSVPDLARLVRCPHRGKGAAVAAGIATAESEYVGFCDLDLSTPLDQLQRVIDRAMAADVVAIGSRGVAGARVARAETPLRELLGRAYNRLLQITVTPGIVDTQCGAKVARRQIWKAILPWCRQVGFAWDAEVIAVAIALGVQVQEVPICWSHDDRSKVNVGRDGLAMALQTPQIWRSARRAAVPRPTASSARAVAPAEGVFEGQQAAELIAADRTHWWFRSKAAFVSTALRRTGGTDGLLVDVGAGAGGVTAMIGWDADSAIVVEAGSDLVRHARHVNGMPSVQAPVAPLGIRTHSAEVVCLLDVIEHLPDPAAALQEAHRILRPGGRLVVNVPAHQWLWSQADVHLGHQRRYNRRLLRDALTAADFEPIFVSHVFSWLVPPVWMVRLRKHGATAELGLDKTSPLIDRAAMVFTAAERLTLGCLRSPVGTSVLAVARAT